MRPNASTPPQAIESVVLMPPEAPPLASEKPAKAERRGQRLVEIDALRGLAALAVVLFHYTTHFTELYQPASPPAASLPFGFYGVNLFFIVSGFVIFMTLERTRRPMDFVVSRFSRLFPAYWLAIVLTFSVTHWLGLPDRLVDLGAAIGNLTMLQGLLHIPHVDGVYWTLEVELLFYVGMLSLYRLGGLGRIHLALASMLGLRLVYFVLAYFAGIDLPWIAYRLLILAYLPWFALGVSVYLLVNPRTAQDRPRSLALAAGAIGTLLVAESLLLGLLAAALAGLVYLAASGRAPWLRHRTLAWLGAISYPLYLIHENIGWAVQLRVLALGGSTDLSVLVALTLSLLLATAMTRWAEQPAMRWIRRRYRERSSG